MVAPVGGPGLSPLAGERQGGELPASRVEEPSSPRGPFLRMLLDSSKEQGIACCAHKDSGAVHPDTVMKGCMGPWASGGPSLSEPWLPASEVSLTAPPAPC